MTAHATCRCRTYPFPHRFLAGQCTGRRAVEQVFEHRVRCVQCPLALITAEGRGCTLLHEQRDYPTCTGITYIVQYWSDKI